MQYVESTVPAATAKPAAAGSDISALIADEVEDLKSKDNQLLTWHKTNISGLIYVSLSPSAGEDVACDGLRDCHKVSASQFHCTSMLERQHCAQSAAPKDIQDRMPRCCGSTKALRIARVRRKPWLFTGTYSPLKPSTMHHAGTTPSKLVHAMATDIQATKQCKSRCVQLHCQPKAANANRSAATQRLV